MIVQVLHCGGEGSPGDFFRNSTSDFVRVQLRRQVQIRIQRVQTIDSLGSVAQALHLHLAKDRLESTLMQPFLLAHDTIGTFDRPHRLSGSSHIQVRLKQ
jgi:hypothetical protein